MHIYRVGNEQTAHNMPPQGEQHHSSIIHFQSERGAFNLFPILPCDENAMPTGDHAKRAQHSIPATPKPSRARRFLNRLRSILCDIEKSGAPKTLPFSPQNPYGKHVRFFRVVASKTHATFTLRPHMQSNHYETPSQGERKPPMISILTKKSFSKN